MRSFTRREFVGLAATSVAAGTLMSGLAPRWPSVPANTASIKALAFDAFPLFDPRPVFALADQAVPGMNGTFANEWRTRQFEYTWLRVLTGRYVDFWRVTQDALAFAAKRAKVDLSPQQSMQLMNAYLELKAWPDVAGALSALKGSGYRLAILSNFTPKMLTACIKSSGLDGVFEQVLSTDQARTYKPDPRAYQLGVDSLGVKKEEILFVAFAGWDAAGARAFGFPTFWVNRLGLPGEELGETPDGSGGDLMDLVRFLNR